MRPDLASYDSIIVAVSGGKDGTACLLTLLEAGAPAERIEIWHHEVDGAGRSFMDWPSTGPYVAALARDFSLPLYRSWREGGFEREMLRGCAHSSGCLRNTGWSHPSRRAGARGDTPALSLGLSQPVCALVFGEPQG